MKHLLGLVLFLVGGYVIAQKQELPKDFVYLTEVIPNISFNLRYYSSDNFIGDTINGYRAKKLIVSKAAAYQLKKVENELNSKGFGLKVFDAYRPQMAVDHFASWARRLDDTLMKAEYYPEVHKQNLFKEGYIASRSGHSRGSTIDLTIINLKTGEELDMGSPFDYFGKESWFAHDKITRDQRANRNLLKSVMNKYNFRGYQYEWWHFTLNQEPFPKIYFNFPIE